MNIFFKDSYVDHFFNICGSFGEINAVPSVSTDEISCSDCNVSATSKITQYDSGVYVRRTKIKNISDEEISLYSHSLKFTMHGGEYQIYSQANSWCNESKGTWQDLVTTVSSRSDSVRNAMGATPFMAIWSRQISRGTVFHFLAYSSWEMRFSVVSDCCEGESTYIEAEFGLAGKNIDIKLLPGEELSLPEVLYYDTLNKTDLDCHKLHAYLNKEYPRNLPLPVIYNSWLYKFDRFTYDDIIVQAQKASELGCEYFVIDAGWFGKTENWATSRGDWDENLCVGFKGRMCEISLYVRNLGMKFGFWLEPESADMNSDIYAAHPEFFLTRKNICLLDFSNEGAVDYITKKTIELIKKYSASFVKFDFNADMHYDKHNTSFIAYFKGVSEYISALRMTFPDLYIENCASGGMRMTARDGISYDSFWLSDNQSPYHTFRIYKDSLLRMPPQWIERWATLTASDSFPLRYGLTEETVENTQRILAIDDATWSNIRTVDINYLSAVHTCGPFGLSFDLTSLNEENFENLKACISMHKKNRDFYKNAVCRILCDTESLTVLEYSDTDFERVEIVVVTNRLRQSAISVCPVLNKNYVYADENGNKLDTDKLMQEGIELQNVQNYTAYRLSYNKI